MGAGTEGGFDMGFSTSFGDITGGLFGSDTTQSSSGTVKSSTLGTGEISELSTVDKQSTSQLQIDEEGILKIIDDILKGTSGLAEIFGMEQGQGLFDSSVATEETSDLLAAISGELAKLTGVTVTTETGTEESEQAKRESSQGTQRTEQQAQSESSGLFDFLGF